MQPISLSKLASNFVGRFLAIGPHTENFIVRNRFLRQVDCFLLELFQLVNHIRSNFSVRNAETSPHFKGQLNNDFSHGAVLPIGFEFYHTTHGVGRRLIEDTLKQ